MPSLRHAMAVQLMRAQPRVLHPSLETIRSLMDGFSRLLPLPAEMEVRRTRIGDTDAEWIVPSGETAERTILYLHGGGYCAGSLRTHRALAARTAMAANAEALVIEYRLAPENPFPAALDDALRAFTWLVEERQPENLVVVGDSAGGGLTLALLMSLAERDAPQPAGAVCLSPWADLAATGDSAVSGLVDDPILRYEEIVEWGKLYAGGESVKHPLVSPLYGCFDSLPSLLIQVGTRELLLDDAKRVAERAAAAGVDVTLEVWPGLIHAWQVFAPGVPESIEALERIGEWIQQRTAPTSQNHPVLEECRT